MSIAVHPESCKADTSTDHTTQTTESAAIVSQLTDYVVSSVDDERSMHEFERGLLDQLLKLGKHLTDQFLKAQRDGDLGQTTSNEDSILHRSKKPVTRKLRSVFGEHSFDAYVYRTQRNEKSAIALRPVDQRLKIGPDRYSPLCQEFSMMFCIDQAFHSACETFEAIFRQRLSVDTLERISRRMGEEACEFMNAVPAPDPTEEGEILVATADGKGVPMVRADAVRLRACDPRPDRPGNRRTAIVAAVYSVDPYIRTPEQIVSALFSSADASTSKTQRPLPCHKRYSAWFSQPLPDLDEPATGTQLAMAWTSNQIKERRKEGQRLVRIMDGQHSLWDEASASQDDDSSNPIEILDLLHVCSYLWKAAKALCLARSEQEQWVKQKLTAILGGQVRSVIRSLRYLSTTRGLKGKKQADVATASGYFERHQHRMQYDEYLAAGYPVSTGVIEGACRHVVKDRKERCGMKWSQPGAQNLLHLRCLKASGFWSSFHAKHTTTIKA